MNSAGRPEGLFSWSEAGHTHLLGGSARTLLHIHTHKLNILWPNSTLKVCLETCTKAVQPLTQQLFNHQQTLCVPGHLRIKLKIPTIHPPFILNLPQVGVADDPLLSFGVLALGSIRTISEIFDSETHRVFALKGRGLSTLCWHVAAAEEHRGASASWVAYGWLELLTDPNVDSKPISFPPPCAPTRVCI